MTDPCIIVRGPDRPNSQKNECEVPVSPFEVTNNVDLDDPLEHSREPRGPLPVNRNPARKTVEVRPRKWDPKGIHGKLRQIRWPELFHLSRYSIELIDEQRRNTPPPPHVDVWVDEIIASGIPEARRVLLEHEGVELRRYVVALHPGMRRWGLFELLNRPDIGPHYRLISMAQKPPKKGVLPADLQSEDHRWEHMRGEVGEYREWEKQDFIIIREQADRRLLGPRGPALLAEKREAEAYNEKDRIENDFVLDMLDYNYWWLNSAAEYGRRPYSVASVEVGKNADKYHFENHGTYTERVRKDSRRYQELMLAKVGIDVHAKPEIRAGLSRPFDEIMDPLRQTQHVRIGRG